MVKGTDLETGLPCELEPVTAHIRAMHGTFQPDTAPVTNAPPASDTPPATEIAGKPDTAAEGGTGIQLPSPPGSEVLPPVKRLEKK